MSILITKTLDLPKKDLEILESLGFDLHTSSHGILDTAQISQKLRMDRVSYSRVHSQWEMLSLKTVVGQNGFHCFDVEDGGFHNAGNDAHWTIRAMILLALKGHSEDKTYLKYSSAKIKRESKELRAPKRRARILKGIKVGISMGKTIKKVSRTRLEALKQIAKVPVPTLNIIAEKYLQRKRLMQNLCSKTLEANEGSHRRKAFRLIDRPKFSGKRRTRMKEISCSARLIQNALYILLWLELKQPLFSLWKLIQFGTTSVQRYKRVPATVASI